MLALYCFANVVTEYWQKRWEKPSMVIILEINVISSQGDVLKHCHRQVGIPEEAVH